MHRVGQDHHRARLTDAEVESMRVMYETWKAAGVWSGYTRLARIFDCGISTARDIVTYRTRGAA